MVTSWALLMSEDVAAVEDENGHIGFGSVSDTSGHTEQHLKTVVNHRNNKSHRTYSSRHAIKDKHKRHPEVIATGS